MEALNVAQDTAYDRLFKWAIAECRGMNRETPDISSIMRIAMRKLRQRPTLFQ